ncbi:MAG TPA: hypothetical protein IAB31_09095 [Candidatus Choladousia intestinavium]|uniref:Uncharacterized protein n=1 Tax=Candidatus Choladousia intestinavium TaxID=2840727 RepID=A0A9D1ADC2_9FIRM|nr:hypothetical protein [Candidatus Choladousia intestinavium]
MKMKKAVLLFALCLMAGGVVQAQESEADPVQDAKEEVLDTVTEELNEAGEAGDASQGQTLSDSWSDYQIQINGTVYQFPMTYEELTALGWTADSESEMAQELEPNQYSFTTFSNGDAKVYFDFVNLAVNNLPMTECLVGGIDIDNYYWPLGDESIVLPGGLARGEATVESITAAYGTPTDTYEGDLYTQLTYSTDSYSSVEFYVYKESGVLEEVSVRNFAAPEDFDAGEASDEVPEAVAAYVKPDALSDDLAAPEIQVDGEVYTLPVPVSVLEADGWTLDEANSDPTIMANNFGWVTLRKGGVELSTIAVNEADYATIPSNCWVESLEVGGYALNADGALPGGVMIGMTEEDFLSVLDAAGVTYEMDDESDNFKYYTYCSEGYGRECSVTVYTGEDGSFTPGTVIEVDRSYEFE